MSDLVRFKASLERGNISEIEEISLSLRGNFRSRVVDLANIGRDKFAEVSTIQYFVFNY